MPYLQNLSIIFCLCNKVLEVNRTLQIHQSHTSHDIIYLIFKYISENIGEEDLSRQTIAKNVHISESYLSHLF